MVRIRRVDPAKYLEVLTALQLECLPVDVPCPVKPGDVWFLGTAKGDPACFACIRPVPGTSMWYLARAGVSEPYQGQGLQRRLIMARVKIAWARGAKSVISDTTATNAASANSLIRCGFRVYVPEYRWGLPDSIYWRLPCPSTTNSQP